MVLSYHQTGSSSQTRQAFVERFPHRRPPDKGTIVKNFQKYHACMRHATSLNRNKGNSSDRPEVARPQLTKSGFNRIVKFDLKFHPFRMIITHQLFHGDLQTYQFLELIACPAQPSPAEILSAGHPCW